jgi:glycosyltransferase involved in cell wall biosynthesis
LIDEIILLALLAHWVHLLLHFRMCLEGYVRLAAELPSEPSPTVSVIIPARNEARDIQATLDSLSRQRGIELEILVVDDQSTDQTAATVARCAEQDGRIQLLAAPPLPPGWLGKPHAMAHGASRASHPWLLFADADVRFVPEAIAAAVAEAERRRADLLTLLPRAILESFWERTIQPVIACLILFGISFAKVNDPANRQSVGVGAFLLVRRATYDAIGGHAAIRDRVVDDYALAQRVKRAGGRIWLADGRDLIAIRMYHGFTEIWRGWSKNLYDGLKLPIWVPLGRRDWYLFEDRPLVVLLLLTVFLTATFVVPLLAPVWAVSTGASLTATALAWSVCGLFVVFGAALCRRLDLGPGWLAALPLGGLVALAIALNSAWQTLARGGPTWRGRRYVRS